MKQVADFLVHCIFLFSLFTADLSFGNWLCAGMTKAGYMKKYLVAVIITKRKISLLLHV